MLIDKRGKPDEINLNGSQVATTTNSLACSLIHNLALMYTYNIYGKKQRKNSVFTLDQKLLLFNSVIKSQSSCCPVIWIFCLCFLNNSLNHIQERVPRLIYDDHMQSFPDIHEMTYAHL